MHTLYRLLFLTSLCCFACTKHTLTETSRSIFVFGTIIDITILHEDPAVANRALDKLEIDLKRSHENWTPWQGSALKRTNQLLQTGSAFVAAPSVTPLIKNSIELSSQSEELYNPAINKLIALWQFHRHEEADITPPDDAAIQAIIKQKPSMKNIIIDGLKLRSNNPAVELNFGAYAKGFAIDRALHNFRREGIKNAIVNAGGDLRVIGQHIDRPWRIGIRDPRKKGAIAWLDINDNEGVFTSGDYERFYEYEDKIYHHILDPRTGYPARGTQSVTVIDNNAGKADAAATALFIAGPENWHRIAKSMGIKYVMLIDEKGEIHMNPAMAKRIQFINPQQSGIILSEAL